MSPALSRLMKVLAFATLFAALDRLLDSSHARSHTLNPFIDSFSQATGIKGQYLDWAAVAALTAVLLWTILNLCRSLGGMINKRP